MLLFTRPGRIAVPRKLGPLTTIDHAAECRPQDVGMTEDGVRRIWDSVESMYRTGLQPAITLVVRRHGRIVVKRALGALSGNLADDTRPLEPLHPDAPICLFSASKAISALLLHKLIEQGHLKIEDRIADFIPEFAQCGKARITVRQLLGHRAGIPDLPQVDPKPELLLEWDEIVRLLCEAKPFDPDFDSQAYHALTAGFIVGELLRRITGRELPELLREWIAEPLDCRYMTYGLAPAERGRSPRNACTGMAPMWPMTRIAKQVLGVPFDAAVEASNADAFYDAVVPAGNIWATADETSRVFQMLLDGGAYNGRRLFRPETVRNMVTRVGRSWQFDRTLGIPMPFSAGFMLGSNPVGLYGLNSGQAFGHIGFMTVICWADPARDISVALLNTGKSLSPSALVRAVQVVGAIGSACPAVK